MLKISIANNTNIDKVFAIRREVFCGEQCVSPQIERDGLDNVATHVLATLNNAPVGCCRLLAENNSAHLGRFAVLRDFRNKGIGKAICKFVVDYCKNNGYATIWLNAQLTALDFYQKLGFAPVGKTFIEADMEHVRMVKYIL